MTVEEIRSLVIQKEDREWFENLELTINFPHINVSIHQKGFTSIYEFFYIQNSEWSKVQSNLPQEISESKILFQDTVTKLIYIINESQDSQKRNVWTSITRIIDNNRKFYFTYDSPELSFLINVYNERPESFIGAFKFITNTIDTSIRDKYFLSGVLMAYEFHTKDFSKILERKNSEKGSIGKIRNSFYEYLNESEKGFINLIDKTNNELDSRLKNIDEIKTQKESVFNEWFQLAQSDHNTFTRISENKIADLESAYEQLLSLKKPAEYWNKRATKMKEEGKVFLNWLIALVVFGCITLYFLLWLTPEGMLLSFIKGQASAIKWSIVYVTFISLLAFGIKVVSKAMFSSFHLARDAEEREQLTYVYLALIKESAVDEKDKSLIMQSLFSRSDTGLLKDDSGPTMPGNIPNKLIQ